MFISVKCDAPARVSLEDPETFTAFHVVAVGPPDAAALAAALESTGLGYLSGPGQAHITTAALVRLAAPASDEQSWQSRFDGMLDYATSKGWYDGATGAIAAHVQWQDA